MENNNILNKSFEHLSPTTRKPQQRRKYTYQKRKQRFISKVTYSNSFERIIFGIYQKATMLIEMFEQN